ncbi:MAG: hypothetical protein KA902_04895 [Arenimonas sp.]|nr:hypothetical protein [Arenimonas sp.]
MRVFVSQIYIQPGVNYPFSCDFQKWIGNEITERVEPSCVFLKKYSEDFEILFRMSAKAELNDIEIRGPTVYIKTKDIEFTIFLPYSKISVGNMKSLEQPLILFFVGVSRALESLGIDSSKVRNDSLDLIEKIISNITMFKS